MHPTTEIHEAKLIKLNGDIDKSKVIVRESSREIKYILN